MAKRLLVDSIWKSANLEGLGTTFPKTEAILANAPTTTRAEMESIEKTENIELKALKYFCFVARTQMFVDGNKRVAQLIANKILIQNDIGIFQIPIEQLEKFKYLLIEFYETNNDVNIIEFMKEFCIRKIR